MAKGLIITDDNIQQITRFYSAVMALEDWDRVKLCLTLDDPYGDLEKWGINKAEWRFCLETADESFQIRLNRRIKQERKQINRERSLLHRFINKFFR